MDIYKCYTDFFSYLWLLQWIAHWPPVGPPWCPPPGAHTVMKHSSTESGLVCMTHRTQREWQCVASQAESWRLYSFHLGFLAQLPWGRRLPYWDNVYAMCSLCFLTSLYILSKIILYCGGCPVHWRVPGFNVPDANSNHPIRKPSKVPPDSANCPPGTTHSQPSPGEDYCFAFLATWGQLCVIRQLRLLT